MKDGRQASLDAELAKLSRDIAPPRDLWPQVLSGIVRAPQPSLPRRPATWAAYAATAAGLCLAAALVWLMVRGHSPASPAQTAGQTAAQPITPGSPIATGQPATSGHPGTSGQPAMADQPVPAALAAGFGEPSDPKYLAARAELERSFNQRLTQLDPATRAKIEADLNSIRQAREDIGKALAAQPDSPVLEQLLASALHDELDLYDDVVRTTQPTTART